MALTVSHAPDFLDSGPETQNLFDKKERERVKTFDGEGVGEDSRCQEYHPDLVSGLDALCTRSQPTPHD